MYIVMKQTSDYNTRFHKNSAGHTTDAEVRQLMQMYPLSREEAKTRLRLTELECLRLDNVPNHEARVLYLFLRSRMDFTNAIIGDRFKVTYRNMVQHMELEYPRGYNGPREKWTDKKVRGRLDKLIDHGLVVKLEKANRTNAPIKLWLPLADSDLKGSDRHPSLDFCLHEEGRIKPGYPQAEGRTNGEGAAVPDEMPLSLDSSGLAADQKQVNEAGNNGYPQEEGRTKPTVTAEEGRLTVFNNKINNNIYIRAGTGQILTDYQPIPATQLPDDFDITLATLQDLADKGIPQAFAVGQWSRFVEYWAKRGESRPNWQLVYINHCEMHWQNECREAALRDSPTLTEVLCQGFGTQRPGWYPSVLDA